MEFADETDLLDCAIVARLPVLIKARDPDSSGRRIVEVEASTEERDFDGDVIMQSALMGSADSFVTKGHLDIDHLSEFGARMGIRDPSSYIVGRPLAVKAIDGGRTFVEGEIARSRDGRVDPAMNRYDEFWTSLQRDPPVTWFSSIYGFPTDLDDCKSASCGTTGATRYLIKGIDWRSLAFTRTPKNTALSSPTRIVSAKAFLVELAKGMSAMPPSVPLPNTMQDVWAAKSCAKCGAHASPSLVGYRHHFAKCMGYPMGASDLYAHALMHKHAMVGRLPALDQTFPGPEAGQ